MAGAWHNMEVNVKLDTKTVSVDDIYPNTWNPNKQSDFIYKKELESIRRFGFVAPLIVRKINEGYEIIDGEHRLRAAKELAMPEISINDLGEVSDAVAKQLTIILNETKGEPDRVELARLVAELSKDIDLDDLKIALPYPEEEIDAMLKLADFDWSEYDNPEEPPGEDDEIKVVIGQYTGTLTTEQYHRIEWDAEMDTYHNLKRIGN